MDELSSSLFVELDAQAEADETDGEDEDEDEDDVAAGFVDTTTDDMLLILFRIRSESFLL